MKTITKRLRLVKAVLNPKWTALAATALLSMQMTFLSAQTTGPGTGQGRNSRAGELQRNPKPETRAGASMDDNRPPVQFTIAGKVQKMEALLGKPLQTPAGNKQPALNLRAPLVSQLRQQRATRTAPSQQSYLHLVLKLTEGGGAEVLSAAEVSGEAVISDEPTGDYVYEVTTNNQTLATQAVQDPFEMRSFSGPEGTAQQGHHIERAKTATIVVKVPKMNLESAGLTNLAVRLYRIKPGAPIAKINTASVARLKQENRLETLIDVVKGKLAPQIRQKGTRIVAQ